jgi:tetratricopeptide (TPR) repeat protein
MESQQMKERLGGWLKRAQELYLRKRYEEARNEVKRVLQESPEHKEANELMAKIREFDAIQEKRKDASQNIRVGLQLFREGKAQAAILELQKGLEIDPTNKQIQAYIADIQGKMENMERARTLLLESTQSQQQGDLEGALAKAEQAVEADPGNEKAHLAVRELKNAIVKAQARQKAAEINEKAIEMYKGGDLLAALVLWSRAFDLNPDLDEVNKYLQQGTAKLLSYGVEGVDGLPEKDAILGLFEQGVRCYIRNDFQMAIEFFRKASEKAPGNAYLTAYQQKSVQMLETQMAEFYQEGMAAQQAGDLVRAQKEFSKVLRLSPGHPDVVRQMATLKASLDQNVEQWYVQGKEHFDRGKMDAAIMAWNRILEVDPNNERARKRVEEANAKRNILNSIG